MKHCSKCGVQKPIACFMWKRIETGERDSYCRACRADYKRAHYDANKARYKANAKAYVTRLAEERTAWLLDYFEAHPCVDCGENDPVVLEFDHLGDKRFGISRGVRDKNWDLFLAEIAKCEVVCANCHRLRTAYRGGFARTRT